MRKKFVKPFTSGPLNLQSPGLKIIVIILLFHIIVISRVKFIHLPFSFDQSRSSFLLTFLLKNFFLDSFPLLLIFNHLTLNVPKVSTSIFSLQY